MEFNPNNIVIQLCMQGMRMEEMGNAEEAAKLFVRAWNEATNDFEKFTAAYYVARQQKSTADRLKWYQTALQLALSVNNDAVMGALAALYLNIAKCYEELGDFDQAKRHHELATTARNKPSDNGPFYHGTKADLQVGDLLTPGRTSNYKPGLQMNHIYFTALVSGAGLAAELAKGDGPERVYVVEPTGNFENDPNVTDKKFPGNPTRSYRTQQPLKIIGEMTDWVRQTPEQLQKWREKLANNKGEIIN
jgi:tetratricopeptide (TPR) repeat protein